MTNNGGRVFLSKNIIVLSFVSFLNDISSEIVMPVLPLFLAALGGGAISLGLLGGLEESVSGFFKILSGYYSDRVKKRKIFVFSGYFISCLSKIILPFSKIWQHVIALRPLDRIGKGVRTPPRDALIADSCIETRRGRAFGFHRTFDTLGAVVGSTTVFLLFSYLGFGLNIIILVAGIIGFLSIPFLILVKDPSRISEARKVVFKMRDLPKPVLKYYITVGVFTLGNFSYMFLIIWATGGGFLFTPAQISLSLFLYILFNLVYAVFSFPAGVISDRIGRKKTLIIGYLFFTLTNIVFLAYRNIFGLVLGFILYGFFNALTEANQRALAADLAPEYLRGTILGSFQALISFLSFLSSLITGLIWSGLGAEFIFVYGAILACSASGLLATIKK
ncbi:MAG: MFS transporter [Candidatus Odinarchaeum yellowstonii]|uniref:MFS transporter n=1 Tax=Odinarchaeota yellowstonii (strain LCB_4) TaxID=1841599 RepID=A0AAF0D2V0_ODILC|nr:MAG: MFS transporter [Candidatus Odinarchaeum yellowstonii]